MKKTARIAIVLVMILAVLSGCGKSALPMFDSGAGQKITVAVRFTGEDGKALYESDVIVRSDTPDAGEATLAAVSTGIEYTCESGLYDGFFGKTATDKMAWMLYVNGQLAQTGADAATVAKGDSIEWKYEDFTKLFG